MTQMMNGGAVYDQHGASSMMMRPRPYAEQLYDGGQASTSSMTSLYHRRLPMTPDQSQQYFCEFDLIMMKHVRPVAMSYRE